MSDQRSNGMKKNIFMCKTPPWSARVDLVLVKRDQRTK